MELEEGHRVQQRTSPRERGQAGEREEKHSFALCALRPFVSSPFVSSCLRLPPLRLQFPSVPSPSSPVSGAPRVRCAGKGGKNRRRGKNENEAQKRELVFKEDGQEYGQVQKMLGNGRLEAACFDGVNRLCHIRGKLRKKVRARTRAHEGEKEGGGCPEKDRDRMTRPVSLHTRPASLLARPPPYKPALPPSQPSPDPLLARPPALSPS